MASNSHQRLPTLGVGNHQPSTIPKVKAYHLYLPRDLHSSLQGQAFGAGSSSSGGLVGEGVEGLEGTGRF